MPLSLATLADISMYDIIQRVVTLFLFETDGLEQAGLLRARPFARTIIFDISRCAFDERERCYVQNWKTISYCPFLGTKGRRERRKGWKKGWAGSFSPRWKTANARVCAPAIMSAPRHVVGTNSTAATACQLLQPRQRAYLSLCIHFAHFQRD